MHDIKDAILPTLGQALSNLGNSYQIFLSSDKKQEKIQMLWQIRMAAIDVHKGSKRMLEALSGKLIGPDPSISNKLSDAVKHVTRGNIHMMVLNLDHLAKKFCMETVDDKRPDQQKIEEKIQYLYQIYYLTADIAETALTASAEPDRNTERA